MILTAACLLPQRQLDKGSCISDSTVFWFLSTQLPFTWAQQVLWMSLVHKGISSKL